MRTTPDDRIADFSRRGWWGDDTLTTIFERAVADNPERLALADQFDRDRLTGDEPLRLSYQELADRVRALAATFRAHGLGQDDVVVVQLPNVAELVMVYLALAPLGVVVSPVPVQYGIHELSMLQRELNPAAVITLTSFKGIDLAEHHRQVFTGECRLFSFGRNSGEGFVALDRALPDEQAIQALDEYLRSRSPSANDIFTICWTSGTTGEPKGVPRSHNMWLISAYTGFDAGRFCDADVFLNPFPLVNMASIGGFLYNWLLCRGTLVLHHPLDLEVFLQQIQTEGVTYTIAPPAILTMLLKNPATLANVDLSSVRAIGSGGAPLSPWMVREFQSRHGVEVINYFGSNEGMVLISGQADIPDPEMRAEYFPRFGVEGFSWKNRVAGRIRTKLVDMGSGAEITEPRQTGELLLWGASLFDGYHNAPETNAVAFEDDGFFHTGDLFEIAGAGELERFYRFIGRCKDIIVRGGMKISPDEIDNLLAGHPAVAEAAVVGYPDEVMEEKVCAIVVPREDAHVDLETINEYLREKGIAVFKLPERLVMADRLPRNPVGKVLRSELRNWVQGNSTESGD